MIKHGGRDIAGDYATVRPHAFGRLDGLAPGAASQIQNAHTRSHAGHIDERISCGGQSRGKYMFPLCPARRSFLPSLAKFGFQYVRYFGSLFFGLHSEPSGSRTHFPMDSLLQVTTIISSSSRHAMSLRDIRFTSESGHLLVHAKYPLMRQQQHPTITDEMSAPKQTLVYLFNHFICALLELRRYLDA